MYLKVSRRVLGLFGIFVLIIGGLLSERVVSAVKMSVPKPLEQINTHEKVIALTFNVDWGEECIPGILDALAKGQAKATFFITGRWAKKHPQLVLSIAQAGHEIENHGYSHPHPDQLSVSANQEEIKKTESIIKNIIGYKTCYYAPPYGERGYPGLKAAEDLGYRTVLWTFDTVDWRPDSTPELIAKRVLNPQIRFGIKPNKRGAIVLMHPKENTLKALPLIISQLTQEGYKMGTINELITLDQVGNTTS